MKISQLLVDDSNLNELGPNSGRFRSGAANEPPTDVVDKNAPKALPAPGKQPGTSLATVNTPQPGAITPVNQPAPSSGARTMGSGSTPGSTTTGSGSVPGAGISGAVTVPPPGATTPPSPGTMPPPGAGAFANMGNQLGKPPRTTPPGAVHTATSGNPNQPQPANAASTMPSTVAPSPTGAQQPAGPGIGSKIGNALKGTGSALGSFARGLGNVASQTVGGVAQTVGAAGGGLKRGYQGAAAGDNFSKTASNTSAAPAIGQNQGSGSNEVADLRARLSSIENLLRAQQR